jgi:hypothetical protein
MDLSAQLKFPRREISLESFTPDGIVLAPEIRASFVVRQLPIVVDYNCC